MRAFHWFDMGSDLFGQGLLIFPLMGAMVFARGVLVVGIAVLYAAFAAGAFGGHSWAWLLGVIAAVVNLLLALSVLIQGEEIAKALLWLIVPALTLWYLLSAEGRRALSV